MNFGALARLVEAILAGHAGSGRTLLLDALNIWTTNVIIFALWFWALDRGSPAAKGSRPDIRNDFLFTQQQPAGESCLHPGWAPGFVDYLSRLYQCNGIFACRHVSTHRASQTPDDGGSRNIVCDHCAGGVTRSWYSQLNEKLGLLINLKTAKALDLTVPSVLLSCAEQVIE